MISMLESFQQYLNIPIALIVMAVAYLSARKLLHRLRLKGVISHGAEGILKLVILVIIVITVLPIVFSSILQRYEIVWLSIATFTLTAAVMIASIYSFIENVLMYLVVVSSGMIREGDNIEIVIDGRNYVGRVVLAEGSHMILRTEHSASVLIPYRKVFNAIIVKKQRTLLKFMVKVYSYNLDIRTLIERVISIVRKSRIIVREEVSVKLHEISEDSVKLSIEVGIMNPGSVGECYEEIARNLTSELPYRVDIEIVE